MEGKTKQRSHKRLENDCEDTDRQNTIEMNTKLGKELFELRKRVNRELDDFQTTMLNYGFDAGYHDRVQNLKRSLQYSLDKAFKNLE